MCGGEAQEERKAGKAEAERSLPDLVSSSSAEGSHPKEARETPGAGGGGGGSSNWHRTTLWNGTRKKPRCPADCPVSVLTSEVLFSLGGGHLLNFGQLPPRTTMQSLTSRVPFPGEFLLVACLVGLWAPLSQATIGSVPVVSIPETPAEGQNVTFAVVNVTGTIRQIDWYRGVATDGSTRLFSYFPGNGNPQRNGVRHTGREFGFPNGSLLITRVRPNDSKVYTVMLLMRPKGSLKGSIELQLAHSTTTTPPPTTPTTEAPPVKELTKPSLMLGWIVAGVVVGILLAGAVGAVLVYRFVLQKADPGTGMPGRLDAIGKKPPAPKHGDKEPIYEMMDSPVESPRGEGKEPPPMSGPLPKCKPVITLCSLQAGPTTGTTKGSIA
nr:carcinoembryonic antigen-related cell adhesion molecule 19 isoform X2 [Zootoca vivipara]